LEQAKLILEQVVPRHGAISCLINSCCWWIKMKYPKIVSLLLILAVFGSVAGAVWALNSLEAEAVSNKPMPKLMIQEYIRSDAVAFIAASHPETAQFMGNFTWIGGAVQTLMPPETYIYSSRGWTLMIQYPLKASQAYSITAEYTSSGIGIPYKISWAGTWENGNVTETAYSFSQ